MIKGLRTRWAERQTNLADKNDNLGSRESDAASAQSNSPPNPWRPAGAILIAEDDPGDAYQTKRIVEKLRLPVPIHVVSDGEEVVAYLEGQEPYTNRADYPYPLVLLLDLKMPGADGFKVLRWLQTRMQHRALPVVVLTAVREITVVRRAYQLGARSFLIKPLVLTELAATLRSLEISAAAERSAGEPG